MPFFRRKKNDERIGLEEEECNLRDMFGDAPGVVPATPSAPLDPSTTSSDDTPYSEASSQAEGEEGDSSEPEENAEAQELMNDNLELMREVVLKIREDDEYARNIYAECPRLQILLNDHPDLRPLFEDPKFVVLNFEQVYRNAGGTLPGDEDADKPGRIKSCIMSIKNVIGIITSHPLFRVFKILMVIKKIVFFFSPTKFMGILKSFLWPSLDDMELDADGLDPEDEDYEAEKTKLSLNQAADRMEDPEIQEQMQEAMDDPDKMEDLIEDNKELRELRDSNPVCAEMMNDPETMKILSDPENLRALSECPDLISEDFANPDMLLDALEEMDADADVDVDGDFEADAEIDDDAEFSDQDYSSGEEYSSEEYSDEEEEDEEDDDDDDDEDGMLDDVEYERDDDDNERERSRSRGKARSANNQQKQERDAEKDGEGGGGGGRFGFLSTLAEAGLGVMDGGLFEDGLGDMFGGGDEMDGLEGGEDLGAIEEVEAGGEGFEDTLEDIEEVDEDGGEYLEQAEENLEDIEETEREEDDGELLEQAGEQAEENLEDVEETEREDESTVQDDNASEDQGVYATMEEYDEGAAGQGADLADEIDAEDRDKSKDKDKEAEEREAQERAARGGGGGFYGDYEDDGGFAGGFKGDGNGKGGDGGGGGFASGFKGEDDDDDDWIQY